MPAETTATVSVQKAEPSAQDQVKKLKDYIEFYLSGISLANSTITGRTTSDPTKTSYIFHRVGEGDIWEISALPSTKIIIDTKEFTLADLKKLVPDDLHTITVYVEWEYDALENRKNHIQKGRATLIKAVGPYVDVVVKSVDVERNIIRVNIRAAQMMLVDVPIAKNAQVKIDDADAKLSDLKPGMRAQMQMSVQPESNLMLEISAKKADKQ